ncbi:MAG: efflux RND transporter permease subunit [Syntrophomonas sp.]|nr:efflux RND transporter permease subunit [Syntrophomonas sp.]
MYKIIAKVIEHRKITLFLTIIIALIGCYAYYLLPRQESPKISVPVAMVITPYPGASANDVRDLVTKKVEEDIAKLDGYDYCKGVSKANVSVVTVYFLSDVDHDKAMQDVRNAVSDVQEHLPAGASASTVNTDVTDTAGILISVSGDNYSYDQLESFGDRFKNELRALAGISKMEVVGKLEKEVKVDISIAKLNRLGLSIEDIGTILAAQNVQIPSGSINYQNGKVTVNTPGNYTSVEDIRNTIIAVSPSIGVVSRLEDIADVYLETEEGSQKIKADGHNAVLLAGYFVDKQNVVIIGKEVRKSIDKIKAQLPPDLVVNEVIYQPDAVSESTNEFMLHLLIGIILVLGAVFLAMGLRNALVVSTAIPLSILFTFIMMYIFGVDINQVSLVALIIALGILVDDAIVVADNIQVRLDSGDAHLQAAYNGATRCTVPNFSATLAIIIAFTPLLGIPGGPGQFMYAIPWVVIVAVGASFFAAMLAVPVMMAGFARKNKEDHKNKTTRVRIFFQNMLKIGLQHKKETLAGVAMALILVVVIVLPRLTIQFFPFVEKDIFYIQINSEKTGDFEATERITDEVAELVKEMPEIVSCTQSVGDGLPKFYITVMPPTPADDYGMVAVRYKLKNSQRFSSNLELASYIQATLDQNISDGKCKVKLLEYAIPTDAKAIVRVSGENMERLVELAKELGQKISQIPGTTNVRDNWDDDSLQLNIDLDEDKASSLGISKYDVQKEINMALYGYNASVYRINGNEYNIRLKSDIKDAAGLENFAVKSSLTGNKTPLKDYAVINYSTKANTISSYNGDLAVDILVDPLPGYDGTVIENQIEADVLPAIDLSQATVSFAGEREDIRGNFTGLGILAFLSIAAIYIVLLIIFKSFIQPLVILTTVPLSLIGSLLGLFIFNQPMSLTALLGIIALVGLVVKNGILLIDFVNEERKRGCSAEEACITGVSRRFNAVIISALTIILALIPLAVSGSSLFSPLAVALMSGLTVATFLTMIIVPVIYSLVEG